jgi:hypothetical protein
MRTVFFIVGLALSLMATAWAFRKVWELFFKNDAPEFDDAGLNAVVAGVVYSNVEGERTEIDTDVRYYGEIYNVQALVLRKFKEGRGGSDDYGNYEPLYECVSAVVDIKITTTDENGNEATHDSTVAEMMLKMWLID